MPPKGPLKVSYEASLELQAHQAADPATIREIPVSRLPLRILPFLLPSRFCESDRLAQFAKQEFGKLPPGHGRVGAICDWIHRTSNTAPAAAITTTSAQETLIARTGVCRDFAHLGIAFCRGIGIPGALRELLCVRTRAAGFPRRVRGLSRRTLVAFRLHP